MKDTIMNDEVPKCSSCEDAVIKPSIVFFGEDLPGRFKQMCEVDFSMCDLLIIMGTSLKVQPFASLINKVKSTTPRLLVRIYICCVRALASFVRRDIYYISLHT